MRLAAAWLLIGQSVACSPEPYYDDDIGIPGIATEPGALAGSWAVRQRYTSTGFVAILARDVDTVGDEYFLIDREWSSTAGAYRDHWTFCIDINGESAGLTLVTPERTLATVVLLESDSEVDHPTGEVVSHDVVQLWALHDLPDTLTTPIPTPDNYQQSPQRDWIFDADEDGHVGCTAQLTGLIEGEGYFIKRAISAYRGVVASADQIVGLIEQSSSWSTLESTVAFAVQTGSIPSASAHQHDDPKRSWFEQVRLETGATCADVEAAAADETLSKLRPF